ncbi:hypothetical protein Tco_0252938 [Tanacetum coccineum]
MRGLCSHFDKQKEVKRLIQDEGLQFFAILETHVKCKNIKKTCETVFGNLECITNGEDNNKGCRIMVGWNASIVQAWLISQPRQYMFILVETIDKKSKEFLHFFEHSNGSANPSSEMSDFQECVNSIEVDWKRIFKKKILWSLITLLTLLPNILGRPFLRMARALIDVHGEQMTLRHDDQSVTFKVGDTKTFSYNIIESVNRVDVIDIACEEQYQEVLEISESGNPTSTLDLMIDSSLSIFHSPSEKVIFLMEEIAAFLETMDESITTQVLTRHLLILGRYCLP